MRRPSHECIHGHPFTRRWLNDLIIALPIGALIPYLRFKDVHLQHHQNASICDPYDDPESWYLSQDFWHRLPRVVKLVFQANNTLVGRMLVTAGGGGDGDFLMNAVLDAYEHDPTIPVPSVLLLGPFSQESKAQAIRDRAAATDRIDVIGFDTQPEALIRQSKAVVGMVSPVRKRRR